jgi:branched-chain amino acid transport system substrate-binding protein
MRRILTLLFVSAILFTAGNSAAQPKSFTIGAALGLTGEAEAFGREELNAAKLALEEINSRGQVRVTLKVEDTGSTNLGTVSAVKKLVEVDGVKIILGPTWLDTFQGCLPITDKRGVLLITPSASIPIIKSSPSKYPLVFSTYFNFQREVSTLIETAAQRELRKIAVLFDQDPYFVEMRRVAAEAAKRLSVELVVDQEFSSGETDFRALILQARRHQAKAILFASSNQASVISFLKQRLQLAPDLKVLGSHDFEGYEKDSAFSGLLHNYLYMAPEGASEAFRKKYQDAYSSPSIMTAANSFDAVTFVAAALVAGAETPEQIGAYLRQNEHESVTFGKVRFSPSGGVDTGSFTAQGSLIREKS